MVESCYIHIPFCKSKCHYCSFISFCSIQKKEQYLEALHCEIKHFYKQEALKTLYIGGGTPSTLSISEIENLIKLFNFDNTPELTIELNPEDVDYDYLKGLYELGINRLSFGCQTFNDEILKQINRRHNSYQVKKVVKTAQDIGFKNISIDFIYGLPNQTPEMFFDDLKQAVNMNLEHISLYGLKIEENCYFYKNIPQNLPDDDIQADMYLGAIEIMKENSYEHYEVSNFAKPNFYSKHNLNYWNNEEYYGFGAGAHSYVNGIRHENLTDIDSFVRTPFNKISSNILTQSEKLEEEIFLGLRKMSGINTLQINEKFNINFEKKYKNILDKYTNLNLLIKTPSGYKFSNEGILVSNVILADFLCDE